MKIQDIEKTLHNLLDKSSGPVTVFASLWPFIKCFEGNKQQLPQTLLQILIDLTGKKRDLLMPTFATGYKDGICNLDQEPSSTGLLSELFRQNSIRTLSAFFSYNIIGPHAEEVAQLSPEYAWGDGSVYDWMEKNNSQFLMLGTHPTNCSYLHRIEWLARDLIHYRYNKAFSGCLIRNNKKYETNEILYVRSLTPPVVNDYLVIYNTLLANNMKVMQIENIPIALMNAKDMKDAYLNALKNDPLITVKNRLDYEELYA